VAAFDDSTLAKCYSHSNTLDLIVSYGDAIGENRYKKLAGFAQRILCSI